MEGGDADTDKEKIANALKSKEDRTAGKTYTAKTTSGSTEKSKPEELDSEGKPKRRFSLCGSMVNVIQNGFEDKFVKNEGEAINEDDLHNLGIAYACKKGLKPESPNQDDFMITFHDQ